MATRARGLPPGRNEWVSSGASLIGADWASDCRGRERWTCEVTVDQLARSVLTFRLRVGLRHTFPRYGC